MNDKLKKTEGASVESFELWDTDKVMEITGWGRTYLSRLCTQGVLPYIPGKPHKFVPQELMAALQRMQVGGRFGKSKGGDKIKSVVTACPFKDTEALAEICEEGVAPTEDEALRITSTILKAHPELKEQITALDDLYLKAVNGAQNATIRHTICAVCNSRTSCTKNDQEPQ